MILYAHHFLSDSISKLSPTLLVDKETSFKVGNIRFWDGTLEDDCLYIALTHQLPSTPPTGVRPLQILCIEDVPIPDDFLNNPDVLIIKFPAQTDPLLLFNTINEKYMVGSRYTLRLSEIFDNLRQGQLHDIINSIGSVYAKPTALFSFNLRLICSSEKYGKKNTPKVQSLVINAGYYPNSLLCKQLEKYKTPVVWADKELIPLDHFQGDEGELFCPIIANHKSRETLGYLNMHFNHKNPLPIDEATLSYICHLLSWRMWRHVHLSGFTNANLNIMLRQILDGNLSDDEVIRDNLKKMQVNTKKNLQLITILAFLSDINQTNYDNIKFAFEKLWPSSITFSYNTSIVFIIGKNEENVLEEEELAKFNKILEENQCTAGISDVFQEINGDIKHHFQRAVTAAVINHERNLPRYYSYYTEVALYNLIRNSDNRHTNGIRDLIDPRVLRLLEIDKGHETDYLDTLRCYWHFSRKSEEICDFMHIHRSTLFYRMNKIKQLLQVDLNDYADSLQINISVMILEYLKELAPIDFKK